MQSYEEEGNVFEFSYLIDWGWFYFITKPLYQLLHWLYGVFGNFGLAILATTVLVKAAFFWFANKSYESMAKMKKVQPEMVEIPAGSFEMGCVSGRGCEDNDFRSYVV